MQILKNNSLSRALHNVLFERMVSFSNQYTPEFPAEPIVNEWLCRLYSDDARLAILVDFDNSFNLTGHAVVVVNEAYNTKVIMIPQLQDDKKDGKFLGEVFEFVDKLREQISAYCSEIMVSKNVKALEKKYGYKAVRTVMLKCSQEAEV